MNKQIHVFTKQGDCGKTKLYDGITVDKDHIIVTANGHMDELTSHIGLAKAMLSNVDMVYQLDRIQHQLIQMMGHLAGMQKNENISEQVQRLEQWIVAYENGYPRQHAFVRPGKTKVSAQLDVTRTVCRRAERSLIKVNRSLGLEPTYLQYINRLSDYFYVMARYMTFIQVIEKEVLAIMKGTSRESVIHEEIKVVMTLNKANEIIEQVKEKARTMGIQVVIAVTGKEGHPIAVQVMDGAYIASYDIAVNKAYTSVCLKMTTDHLSTLAKPHGPLYGIQHTNGGRIVIFGGGIPLTFHDEILGGLGVSGGSTEEDTLLAAYGLDIFRQN